MDKPDDGGSAFPYAVHSARWEGMTLRDYFAAAALSEALHQEATGDSGRPCLYDEAAVARVAYRLADAMLAERKKER